MNITDEMIDEKAAEILNERMADDSYFGDAVCDCYKELRDIFNANNTDDKLNAVDVFQQKITQILSNNGTVRQDAYDFISKQLAWGEA